MRYKKPDRKNALSIINATEMEMAFTLSLKPTEESAPTIVRNIYECFRMLGDALLVVDGIESEDHLMPIGELLKLKVKTKRPTYLIDNLRRLRHNINYYGYRPNVLEAEDAVSVAGSCFDQLFQVIKKMTGE